MLIAVAAALAAVLTTAAAPAMASNVTIPTAGTVSVEFVYQDALFINQVSLTSPQSRFLFDTRASRIGTRVALGTFAANTEFRFQLQATTGSGTYTWSSDPSANSDGKDHLRVTELFDGDTTLDNRVYKLEWEDDIDLGDGDFNDAVAILRVGGDTDGDGLYDDWERFGIDANNDGDTADAGEQELVNGIDQNGDGDTLDPGERADPRHKDIFLEMDWMACATAGGDCAAGDTHTHRPQAASITNVIQAFANHPSVSNPDGTNGINVHIDVSNAIAHQNVLNFNGGALGCSSGTAGTGFGDFDTVKAANLANPDVRRFAFHYALAIHMENQAALTDSTQRFSGCGETPGNDFYISFGGWGAGAPTVQQEAGTIAHELGHNLGLQHGGNEAVNRKPNYLSIMSYAFQLRGIPTTNRIDYSRSVLPSLNEASLNEAVGIQDGTDNTFYFCPGGTVAQGSGSGAIDWNCDGTLGTAMSPVAVDINGAGGQTTLTGFNDWPQVVANLPFQASAGFQDGEHPELPPEELDVQTARDTHVLTPAPVLDPAAPQTAVYGEPAAPYTLRATDADSSCAQLTFTANGLPAGLSVANNGDCTATVSGTPTGPVGTHSVTYRVTDEEGNVDSEISTYQVIWHFAGFFAPLDNRPTINVMRAGASVPVKFSLAGDQGLAIMAGGSPSSQRISCDSGAPLAPVEETVTAGGSGLSYDATSDQYTYVWKTERSWAGTCRQLIVTLADGTSHRADFSLR
jgi:hypothetical protein